jgi:hypothetical protein
MSTRSPLAKNCLLFPCIVVSRTFVGGWSLRHSYGDEIVEIPESPR